MKQGDREAGNVFFSKYIDVIYRAFKYTLKGTQEQDLRSMTQAVCTAILEELRDYNPKFAVSTWVNNLVLRHRVGFLRVRKKQQEHFLPIHAAMDPRDPEAVQLIETLAGAGPDALGVLQEKERLNEEKEKLNRVRSLLQKFLSTLGSETDRGVFTDGELLRLSYADIAEKHNLTLDAVKARLKRTRQKWAAFLKEHQCIE
jgi:RNA polymerase sigma factor (sigma-70 family)